MEGSRGVCGDGETLTQCRSTMQIHPVVCFSCLLQLFAVQRQSLPLLRNCPTKQKNLVAREFWWEPNPDAQKEQNFP